MMDDGAINCKHTVLASAQTHTHTHTCRQRWRPSQCVWGTVWVFPAGDLPVLSMFQFRNPSAFCLFLVLLTSLLVLLPLFISLLSVMFTRPSAICSKQLRPYRSVWLMHALSQIVTLLLRVVTQLIYWLHGRITLSHLLFTSFRPLKRRRGVTKSTEIKASVTFT